DRRRAPGARGHRPRRAGGEPRRDERMTLRARLLLAQAPMALAMVLVAVVAILTAKSLGQAGERILADNNPSALAAPPMQESIERLDSAALFIVIGEQERASALITEHRTTFERELVVEEHNITEPGEDAAAQALRAAWDQYRSDFQQFLQAPEAERRTRYLSALQPDFQRVKAAADQILDINQDAMVLKSTRLRQESEWLERGVVAAVLVSALLGLLASAALTARALRPVGVLGQAVRRLGQGDYAVRARVPEGGTEISQLAADFNAMAESLQR